MSLAHREAKGMQLSFQVKHLTWSTLCATRNVKGRTDALAHQLFVKEGELTSMSWHELCPKPTEIDPFYMIDGQKAAQVGAIIFKDQHVALTRCSCDGTWIFSQELRGAAHDVGDLLVQTSLAFARRQAQKPLKVVISVEGEEFDPIRHFIASASWHPGVPLPRLIINGKLHNWSFAPLHVGGVIS